MTKPTFALTELVEKGAYADLLKQMIQFVAQRMMEIRRREPVRRWVRWQKP